MSVVAAERETGGRVRVAAGGQSFACAPGQSVLLAGLAAGLGLPYECASGSCGSCRCKLLSGEIVSRWPDAPGLSERDRRKGNIVLMCQSEPVGDINIDVRVRPPREVPRPFATSGRIEQVRTLTADMLMLTLALDQPMAFLPGQFVLVDVPGCGRRAYSMANIDRGDGQLVLIVKVKPGGAVSETLCRQRRIGDRLSVEGPYGVAYLRGGARPVVGIAGGSGLAPVWSIAQAAADGARDVHVYFGVNTERDACFAEEFTRLRAGNDRVRTHLVVRDGMAEACRAGLVGDAVTEDLPDLTGADVYMAGPPPMIDAILSRLVAENRVDSDHVFFDRFA